MDAIRTPVSPEDKYIEIIFATLKSCANNRIYSTSEFLPSIRVLDSLMEQYKDDDFTTAMGTIEGWKAMEQNRIGVSAKGLMEEHCHQWFTELAKLIQRSGFTPPVVMDAVIKPDDILGGSNDNTLPGKNQPVK